MGERLTAKREADLRVLALEEVVSPYGSQPITDLLAELDAVRAERDQADQTLAALHAFCTRESRRREWADVLNRILVLLDDGKGRR
jgi:hypothetical protein